MRLWFNTVKMGKLSWEEAKRASRSFAGWLQEHLVTTVKPILAEPTSFDGGMGRSVNRWGNRNARALTLRRGSPCPPGHAAGFQNLRENLYLFFLLYN